MKLPDDTVAHLAELEEDALDQVGEELAATEEFEEDGWSVDEVKGIRYPNWPTWPAWRGRKAGRCSSG